MRHGDDRGACVRGASALIIGIGSDLCDIERIETTLARHGERFTARAVSPRPNSVARIDAPGARDFLRQKIFAAREACAKALGTGLRRGVFWRDMGLSTFRPGSRP